MKTRHVATAALFCLSLLFYHALSGAPAIDWTKAEDIRPGIKLLKLDTDQPRLLKINLMRIDLRTPGLKFTGTPRDADWGKPMPDYEKMVIRTKRVRTRDFLLNARAPKSEGGLELDMVVAANAAPWKPWVKPYTHKYGHPHGLCITDGEIICDTKPHRAQFVIYEDGRADIVTSVPEADYKKIRMTVAGFAIILRKGELQGQEGPVGTSLHPRIAYGLSRDRNYFYIITIDGRQKGWSLGANTHETARFLKDAGSSDAINMDGGGSTTLCYWDAKRQTAILANRPTAKSHERSVGSNIGIYLEASARAGAPDLN
ncbi:phosphodiester glycosidase family protein [Ereboglobus luteus]|uniref:Phosphodiester glycosidase domain-containing protein n=1 Tax=Ereboglobus luteus TaxID=1796921 RepID=A0A2U8E0N0_9BACT|nr:phosphodiester glycosidase family protein [Ereboglobus luteus]AWI08398.1 hypothetical protein CKA38_03245 [Ereboglobus luteus]